MTKMIDNITIVDVTVENVDEFGFYCIKNKKAQGYQDKLNWFKSKINAGLKIKIIEDVKGKQLGFIEYIPTEKAWRPVNAKNYYYIQCITVMSKNNRQQGLGKLLIDQCIMDAKSQEKAGICVMSSDGPWMATKELFMNNDFKQAQALGRFELLYKKFDQKGDTPVLNNWTNQQKKYKGWNLVYADQCPWHEKSVTDLLNAAYDHGIELIITKFEKPEQAQNGPSGFGTYALIKDGKLLADHYISRTRFENIMKKEK